MKKKKRDLKVTQHIGARYRKIKFVAIGIIVAVRARGRECKLVTNPTGCPLFLLALQMA
jgi:hypothetical protein